MCHKDTTCDQFGCWAGVAGRNLFCLSHLRQNQHKVQKLFRNIYQKLIYKDAEIWPRFVKNLNAKAFKGEKGIIKLNDFIQILKQEQLSLREKQSSLI